METNEAQTTALAMLLSAIVRALDPEQRSRFKTDFNDWVNDTSAGSIFNMLPEVHRELRRIRETHFGTL